VRLNALGFPWVPYDPFWEISLTCLHKYTEQEGHARVPRKYKTEDGLKLGVWVSNKRKLKEELTAEQIDALEQVNGWTWNVLEFQWEEGFSYLNEFVEQEGHTQAPSGYKTENGYRLGSWINKQRAKKDQLTPERIKRLESLKGWAWSVLESQWEQGFTCLNEYIEREGHARVPLKYKTEDDYNLGSWVANKRSTKVRLTSEQINKLESLSGWVWGVSEYQWEQGFSYLKTYVEREGHARIVQSYKTEDDYNLGSWVTNKRSTKERLTSEQINRLESLSGWAWDVLEYQWEQGFSYLKVYIEQEGHALVSAKYKTDDGYKLGMWVTSQRSNKNSLTPDRRTRLESLSGWVWDVLEFKWEQGFSYVKTYVEQEGYARVPTHYKTEGGFNLGHWVCKQRRNKDQLTSEQTTRLETLKGWVWSLK